MAARIPVADILAAFEETKKWRPKGNIAEAARALGCSNPTVARAVAGLNPGRGETVRNTRNPSPAVTDRIVRLPQIDSPFLSEKRTKYPSSVVDVTPEISVLKDGYNQQKIGRTILRGAWSGMPIWTLTLEERATCPTSCRHWRSCYGNTMNWAIRHRPGRELEQAIWNEVHALGEREPDGFVVRLHILGDFYSPEYVALWGVLLDRVPALRVFGYTARIDGKNDPIAAALINLVRKQWDRFAVRFSNAPIDECSTVSIEHPIQAPAGAIVCPEQRGLTESCSTCALCWSTRKPIAFLQH